MLRLTAACLSAFLVASCGSSTSPERERPAFVVAPVNSPGAPEGATDPPTVRVREGGLDVLGIIGTPNPCVIIEATLQRGDRAIDIAITARGNGDQVCVAALGSFAYEVAVDDLQPGSYRVSVVHSYSGTGWPTTEVLDEVVAVP